MYGLLTPVSTTYLKAKKEPEPLLTEVTATKSSGIIDATREINSADDALEALKGQPDYETLINVLRFLSPREASLKGFHFQTPGPKSAGIVHILVSEIAPNYWTLLLEGSHDEDEQAGGSKPKDAELFVDCLRSVTGLNALLTEIRAQIQEARSGGEKIKRADLPLNLNTQLDLLAAVLSGDQTVRHLFSSSVAGLATEGLKRAQTHKLVSILTNGQIPSVASEAVYLIELENVRSETKWLTDGVGYGQWIGENLVAWANSDSTEGNLQICCDVFSRSLSLGHSETITKTVLDGLLFSKGADPTVFSKVAFGQARVSRKVMNMLLKQLSDRFLGHVGLDSHSADEFVSAAASILKLVACGDETRKSLLIDWCASSSGAGLGDGVGIRRAVLAALAEDRDTITTVLERSLNQFGDELYVKHAAILQQDVHTQVLLLAAGYVSKLSPIKLTLLMRSGSYLSTISNRIGATQVRARFLGMVVGESLSALIDNKEKKLSFHMEETETEEAQALKDLIKVSDVPGPWEILLSEHQKPEKSRALAAKPLSRTVPKKTSKPKPKPAVTETKPKPIIQEIDSSGDEDEDDLVAYAKDSDPEDSDEDPTLVQRNKTKPPVYIRDLIVFLRDTENYDKQKLAVQTAPTLIRRKANYGTEVSSHAEELAGLLVGLQDKFDVEDFSDLRLQSMIALVVAQPKQMAPWFARTFFEGDYSLSQRTSVLITLGLAAREMAGFQVSQYQAAAAFPSKRLPEKMEPLFLESHAGNGHDALPPASQLKALPPNALDSIGQSLTSSFLAPLAAEAADAATGPETLKLQSFTARYKSKTAAKPRVRAIPNTTASLLAAAFFSPLTAHFQVALRSARPLVLNPALLALYLQTLGVVIHAAGPSTLALPQLTAELWDLLLGVRVHVLGDLGATRGWFVAMASLLEVNNGDMRRLCETQPREIVETREWVSMVFERTRGEDGGEENDVKMLAAGVLIKLGEAMEKYQALLMGDLVDFT